MPKFTNFEFLTILGAVNTSKATTVEIGLIAFPRSVLLSQISKLLV